MRRRSRRRRRRRRVRAPPLAGLQPWQGSSPGKAPALAGLQPWQGSSPGRSPSWSVWCFRSHRRSLAISSSLRFLAVTYRLLVRGPFVAEAALDSAEVFRSQPLSPAGRLEYCSRVRKSTHCERSSAPIHCRSVMGAEVSRPPFPETSALYFGLLGPKCQPG